MMAKSSKISEEEAAAKKMLCAKYAPKCITGGCPLEKHFCFDAPSLAALYNRSNPKERQSIKRILERVIKEGVWMKYVHK